MDIFAFVRGLFYFCVSALDHQQRYGQDGACPGEGRHREGRGREMHSRDGRR